MSLVPLVPVDRSILSSFDAAGKTGGPRAQLRPLVSRGNLGVATADTAAALLALANGVQAAGGDFRVTECHRNVTVQRAARDKYDAWVRAGKPAPGSSGFNANTMKAAFVALPGRSMHNAGRAIDIHVDVLRFPQTDAKKQLDRLWEIALPLGWSPAIRSPDEGASESWHFDFFGDLQGVRTRLGYEQAALCGAILVGHGAFSGHAAELQALLVRAGFDLGEIDGVAGAKTRRALAAAVGISESQAATVIATSDRSHFPRLLALPAR